MTTTTKELACLLAAVGLGGCSLLLVGAANVPSGAAGAALLIAAAASAVYGHTRATEGPPRRDAGRPPEPERTPSNRFAIHPEIESHLGDWG